MGLTGETSSSLPRKKGYAYQGPLPFRAYVYLAEKGVNQGSNPVLEYKELHST